MGAGIIALLTALPGIVKLLENLGPDLVVIGKNFGTWVNHVTGNDPQGVIKRVGAAMSQLSAAKTEAERQDAAETIAKAIRGL